MAAELVPLVMIPRHATIAGGTTFTTSPIDVSAYELAHVTLWRGKMIGTPPPTTSPPTPPFYLWFEWSTDQATWTNDMISHDPGENTQVPFTFPMLKRWLRVRVELYEDDNIVSCWAVGSLERRLS